MKLFVSKKDEGTFSIAFKLYTISIMRVAIILNSSIQIFIQCSFIACIRIYFCFTHSNRFYNCFGMKLLLIDNVRIGNMLYLYYDYQTNFFDDRAPMHIRLCLNEHTFVCVCVHCFVNSFSIHIIKSRYTKVGL